MVQIFCCFCACMEVRHQKYMEMGDVTWLSASSHTKTPLLFLIIWSTEMATSRYFRPVRGKPAADSGDASPRQPEQNASQMSATLLTVASDVLKIKQTTAELKNNVDTMQVRLTKAEGRISDIEETTQQLVTDRKLHSKWMDKISALLCQR